MITFTCGLCVCALALIPPAEDDTENEQVASDIETEVATSATSVSTNADLPANTIATSTSEPTATHTPITMSTDTPSPTETPEGFVTRDDYGDEWAFTVDTVVIDCTAPNLVIVEADERRYALNGMAQSHTDLPLFDPIWRDDPDVEGLKVSIGPFISLGLELC